jgi:hypothetical protein
MMTIGVKRRTSRVAQDVLPVPKRLVPVRGAPRSS